MKYMKSLFAILFFAPWVASAALNLAEPEVLMAKAQENRIALREVLLDIEMNIPEMRDQPTFEKYFFMLDGLDSLAVSLKLDEIYPKMVSRLGLRMTGVGMRWLDVTKDSSEKLQYYVKWMESDTLARLLDNINYQLSFVKDKALLAVMAKNIESILPLVDERADGQVQLKLGYRRLISDVAIVILRNPNLPSDEVAFWVAKLNTPASVSEYLELLNQDIYSLTAENKENGREYLNRLLILKAQVNTMKDSAPSWLGNSVADAFVELLLRSVRFELILDKQKFTEALDALTIRSTQSLMQQWSAQEKVPSANYSEYYLAYSQALVAHGRKLSMTKDTDELEKWLARAAVPILAKKLNIEGNYAITDEKGQKWYFTVAYARENMLVAAFGSDNGAIYKTFYNITYSATLGSFVASEREPDTDHQQNPPIKFNVNEKGQIKIVDPYVRVGSNTFTGQKVQNFTDLWTTFQGPVGAVDDAYQGEIILPSGATMKIKLMVTSFDGYTIGRMDSAEGVTVDFNIGTKGTDGILILTSGRNPQGSWMQIRGYLTPEGFKACVIVGGKAQNPKFTLLKRVNK